MSRIDVARAAQARLKMVAVLLRSIVAAAALKFLMPFIRSKAFQRVMWLLFLPLRAMAGFA